MCVPKQMMQCLAFGDGGFRCKYRCELGRKTGFDASEGVGIDKKSNRLGMAASHDQLTGQTKRENGIVVSRSTASRSRRTQGPSMFRNECVIKNDLDVFEELWHWLERCLERACEMKERLVDSREDRRRAGKGKVERGLQRRIDQGQKRDSPQCTSQFSGDKSKI
jgi:hypothetical protein